MSIKVDSQNRRFSSRAERLQSSEIREFLKLLDQPYLISFAGGVPDPSLFPTGAIREAYEAILSDPDLGSRALQYSASEGLPSLRQWIVSHMKEQGVRCGVQNIVITTGSQQALDSIGKLFLAPRDTVLVHTPTYLGALQAFNSYEPRYDRLPAQVDAAKAPVYERAARVSGGHVQLAYVVPDFCNPTGETMSLEARIGLLDLADALGAALIEDSAYRLLRFDGESIPSILALDVARKGSIERTNTLYCGTFSKTIAPGFRLGWICASREIIQKLVLIKQGADLNCSNIAQMVVARVVNQAHEPHVSMLRKIYANRRDAMLLALSKHMPSDVRWTNPQGGMFVWATLPEELDGADLLAEAVTAARVAFVPGSAFFALDRQANTIRLSYSRASEASISEGISRLARLIDRFHPRSRQNTLSRPPTVSLH